MSFTLKEIPGAVVEKKDVSKHKRFPTRQEMTLQGADYGFNEGIDAQSSKKFQFNREKLYLKTLEAFNIGIDEFQKGYITKEEFCKAVTNMIADDDKNIVEVESA